MGRKEGGEERRTERVWRFTNELGEKVELGEEDCEVREPCQRGSGDKRRRADLDQSSRFGRSAAPWCLSRCPTASSCDSTDQQRFGGAGGKDELHRVQKRQNGLLPQADTSPSVNRGPVHLKSGDSSRSSHLVRPVENPKKPRDPALHQLPSPADPDPLNDSLGQQKGLPNSCKNGYLFSTGGRQTALLELTVTSNERVGRSPRDLTFLIRAPHQE